ncbi:MAG: outer membrane lipoprotein-sorting protein [Treponema sp.]|jgi:outer membrane lipoprotein-sorting protein|nr:outer membrane lipoprotein-sorting protein [Treponema sp.]
MKRFILVFSALLVTVFGAAAQDAASIIRASRDRIGADTTSNRSRMIITAKNGSTTERRIDQYSKDGPNGSRMVVVFQSPANVANTRFLTMENRSGANDQWIFLPSLGKVRRIAASEGSGSFVGTDFSYDDISSADRNADLDTHTLLREENLNGKACYVIESKPKDRSYQYSKMVQWIGKNDQVNYRIDLFDKRGVHVKTLETLELKDIQGRLSPVRTRMTTLASGTNTTINVEILKYDDPIPEQVFTTSFLEKGRAR